MARPAPRLRDLPDQGLRRARPVQAESGQRIAERVHRGRVIGTLLEELAQLLERGSAGSPDNAVRVIRRKMAVYGAIPPCEEESLS